ncbi:MTERF3 [Branchiostoma lanceolatum]|uniref:mTERF3 protein n=1 Tax=Branchiostoma lanceolatum TaxID=7740 RepID=A0A8K0A606_BRALA|nr:MTERF3 [Branchiostoma lanceolatum]
MGHRVLTYEEVTCAFRWNRGICEGRRCAISTETGHRGKLVECVVHKLVHLGVDLHKVSKKRHAANLIAKLDFDSQVKEKLMFLLDVGVAKEDLGGVISVNPFILGVELERLERRVLYLMSKKFKKEE